LVFVGGFSPRHKHQRALTFGRYTRSRKNNRRKEDETD
jgi:hypothetical protein